MIPDIFQLRPPYGEVDQMGYLYHANYVSYCHQARYELLRKVGMDEITLEKKNRILPVISSEIIYKKPVHFDQLIPINRSIRERPEVCFCFEFEIKNEPNTLLSKAKSRVVFVNNQSGLPLYMPGFIENIFKDKFKSVLA